MFVNVCVSVSASVLPPLKQSAPAPPPTTLDTFAVFPVNSFYFAYGLLRDAALLCLSFRFFMFVACLVYIMSNLWVFFHNARQGEGRIGKGQRDRQQEELFAHFAVLTALCA